MKEKLRNLFDEMKVRSRYKSMNAIINMIEPLINQEVEKRIRERMPQGDDAEIAQIAYERKQADELIRFSYSHCYRDFMAGVEYCCSRLTKHDE